MNVAAFAFTSVLGFVAPQAPTLEACAARRAQDPAHWRGYTCIYVYARKTGDYDGALAHTRALVESEPSRTWARYILADLLLDAGLDGAPPLYRAASEEFAAAEDWESATLSRIAFAFSFDAEDEHAIAAELEAAGTFAARHEQPWLLAQVRVQQARLMLRYGGSLDAVSEDLSEARAVTFPDGPYELQKYVLSVEADFEQVRDRPEVSLARLETLLELAEQNEDTFLSVSTQVRRIALLLESPGLQHAGLESLAAALEAIDASALASNPYANAGYLCLKGDLAVSEEAARGAYVECLAAAEELTASDAQRSARHGLGLLDDAPERLVEAGELARRSGRSSAYAQLLAARASFRRGDAAAGLVAAEDAFEAFERVGLRQVDPVGRARWLSAVATYYDEVVSWLIGDPGAGPSEVRIEQALRVVERLRARTIADALERAKVRDRVRRGAELERVLAKIRSLQTRLRGPDILDASRAAALRELAALEDDETRLLDANAAITGERATSSVRALQSALEPGQAIVSFQFPRKPHKARWEAVPAWAWVVLITPTSVRTWPLPSASELEPRVALFAGAVSEPEVRASLGARLYADVLSNVVDAVGDETTDLVIIPDGPLHRLPFAALQQPDGRELGHRFSLSRAPSLSVWHALRTQPTTSQAEALAVVDPRAADVTLPRLEHARAEGDALAAVLPTTVRTGAGASEAFVRSADLQPFSIIHVGAHAVLDEEHPDRAAVMLASGAPGLDGALRPPELAALELQGSLVVLAACRSASGPILGDEGPMGLAHALFRGGARTVVASLWPLEDEAASLFFRRLYAALGQGRTVAEAVATVRRDLDAAGVDPSVWAGVVVLGDGAYVPVSTPHRSSRWWVLLALLGLLGGVVATRRRRVPTR
ncbi:MAG: CHAT domain-containing protein [Myxococcota bacterium]